MKHLPDLLTLRHRRLLFRMSVHSSVRLSTFMSTFDIYVKVSILINYKTNQPSNLAWNISLTSRLCEVLLTDGQVVFLRVLRFSPTFDERSARYKWNILERAVKPKSKKKKKKYRLCDIDAHFSIRLSVRPSVCLLTVLLCRSSTFMSKLVF